MLRYGIILRRRDKGLASQLASHQAQDRSRAIKKKGATQRLAFQASKQQ
jgi:hypothetical protein